MFKLPLSRESDGKVALELAKRGHPYVAAALDLARHLLTTIAICVSVWATGQAAQEFRSHGHQPTLLAESGNRPAAKSR